MKTKNSRIDVPGQPQSSADHAAVASLNEGLAGANSVAELQAKVVNLEDGLLRAKADFQNLQRRAAAEHADAVRYANAELMRALVKVVDDFERSDRKSVV